MSTAQHPRYRENTPIPVRFRVVIQRREDNGKDNREVITHKVNNILVVPVKKSPLCYLEMLAVDTPRELLEQRDLDLLEFDGIGDVQHFFHLVQKHNLFWRVDLGPVLKKSQHDLLCQSGVLF